jgi:hypothetical protein
MRSNAHDVLLLDLFDTQPWRVDSLELVVAT